MTVGHFVDELTDGDGELVGIGLGVALGVDAHDVLGAGRPNERSTTLNFGHFSVNGFLEPSWSYTSTLSIGHSDIITIGNSNLKLFCKKSYKSKIKAKSSQYTFMRRFGKSVYILCQSLTVYFRR